MKLFVTCDCGGEVLECTYDDMAFYFSMWRPYHTKNSFLQRLGYAWRVLKNGHPYEDQFCFSKEKANSIKNFLNEAIQECKKEEKAWSKTSKA